MVLVAEVGKRGGLGGILGHLVAGRGGAAVGTLGHFISADLCSLHLNEPSCVVGAHKHCLGSDF